MVHWFVLMTFSVAILVFLSICCWLEELNCVYLQWISLLKSSNHWGWNNGSVSGTIDTMVYMDFAFSLSFTIVSDMRQPCVSWVDCNHPLCIITLTFHNVLLLDYREVPDYYVWGVYLDCALRLQDSRNIPWDQESRVHQPACKYLLHDKLQRKFAYLNIITNIGMETFLKKKLSFRSSGRVERNLRISLWRCYWSMATKVNTCLKTG